MNPRDESAADDVALVVIGGGITGCAVARDAAARGLSVVLLEKRDLAAGTSSRSTKLLHGGLRYLEHGHLRLVREALHERELTARLAPALARPLHFVMPVRPGTFPGRFAARIGVGLYDLLSGRTPMERGHSIEADELRRIAPALSPGWTAGIAFMDRQTDDARLTVAIARDAKHRGASIRLGVTVTGIERIGRKLRVSCRDEEDRESSIVAGCVVNASGAWADGVRRLAGNVRPILRTSRGAHLVLQGFDLHMALILPGAKPKHRVFAIPWRGVVLFGTTDVADADDPGRELPELEDLRVLFETARQLFPAAGLTRRHVLSSFTGVRPLLAQPGDTLASSREHRVIDEDGLVTIAGGKLTTWRTMAIAGVDAAVKHLRTGDPSPRALVEESLPGGDLERPDLDHVLAYELARHADDVIFRRLPIGHDPDEARRQLPAIVAAMSSNAGWSALRCRMETDRVTSRLERDAARLDEALGPR